MLQNPEALAAGDAGSNQVDVINQLDLSLAHGVPIIEQISEEELQDEEEKKSDKH